MAEGRCDAFEGARDDDEEDEGLPLSWAVVDCEVGVGSDNGCNDDDADADADDIPLPPAPAVVFCI